MAELYITGSGQAVYVHEYGQCRYGPYPIHNVSDHHMVDWPTHWRDDRKIMERLCHHGIGHPDPDCHNAIADGGAHGCDGCCIQPKGGNPLEDQ